MCGTHLIFYACTSCRKIIKILQIGKKRERARQDSNL